MRRAAFFSTVFLAATAWAVVGCSAAAEEPAAAPSAVPSSAAPPDAPDADVPSRPPSDASTRPDAPALAPFSVLPWWSAAGIPVKVVLLPNQGDVIGIHSASNVLVVAASEQQAAENNPTWTLGIREVEPLEYNTQADYRAMVGRLVKQAEGVATSPRRILLLFNTGSNGSHDPMTLLPGAGAPNAAADLEALLAAHPDVRLSMEVYCSGAMTVAEWHARLVALKTWASDVGVSLSRVTVNEDLSNTTAASGESYGTLGDPTTFESRLVVQADDAKKMGFGGVDYIATPPSGTYPTLASTYDTIRTIYKTTNVDGPPP